MGFASKVIRATVEEAAEQLAAQGTAKPPDPLRWVKRGVALGVLAIGWTFILWINRFHVTAPTIFVCIGFLAVELAVYNLFRSGTQAVGEDDEDDGDSTWGRPLGAKTELEREKKALLKAIKEAEFDREMGKLSQADAEEMIGLYRARAIDVIKELDKLGGGQGTVREQIEREVKARLELETRSTKAVAEAKDKVGDKAGKKKKDKKTPAKAAADSAAEVAAAAATAAASPAVEIDQATAAAAADAEAKEAAADAQEAAAEAATTDAADAAAQASKPSPAKEATS